jgi:nitroreductase
MELIQAVKGRRSIRKFKADKIPPEVIREILADARWAPSWGNTQPWEFYVLTGEALETFRKENAALLGGTPVAPPAVVPPDVPMPEVWPAHMKKRYGEIGAQMLDALGIKREDKEARNRYYDKMAELFNAPCLIVAGVPKDVLIEYAMLDVGLIMQTICLLAHDRGIGSCIMAVTVRNPQILRRIASIPEDKRIIMGVVLGYPEPDAPINRFERTRAQTSEIVHWVDG